jgi:hypothetical protein
MKTITLIWVFLVVFSIMIPVIVMYVENNFEEEHPFMKWWRKHIVARDPEDDIYK